MNKLKLKTKLVFVTLMNFILFILLNYSFITLAYISTKLQTSHQSGFDVNLLFDRLDESLGITAPWGSKENPYLINEPRHLQNLYTLQNNLQSTLINKDSVFQVSNNLGKPVFVGGESPTNLLELFSIGSEENPFISTFRGVQTTIPGEFVSIKGTSELSDTSIIGNIRILASGTQQDIGLFGTVGPKVAPITGTIGRISTLLVTNVEIKTSSVGGYNPQHTYFVTNEAYETNHIGILAGHAQFTEINDISVYYSGPNGNPTVKAFNINNVPGLSSGAKYTSSTGIVGYYKKIIVNDAPLPVTSDGFPTSIGSGNTGLDLGVVNSQDLWQFMEDNNLGGSPIQNEYSLQDTFGTSAAIYRNADDLSYFQIGVFTFVHSNQVTKDDTLTKLWTTPNSDQWSVSTTKPNPTYASATQAQPVTAYNYPVTQITNKQMANQTTSQLFHTLNSTLSNPATYRYMMTVTISNREYALVRNGATASPKEVIISGGGFTIPANELEYYTFSLYNNIVYDEFVPPYGSDGKRLVGGGASFIFNNNNSAINPYSSSNEPKARYAGYGKEITREGVIKEIPRPLRIWQPSTPTTSFMATSSTGFEGLRFIPSSATGIYNVNNTRPDNRTYSLFTVQRTSQTGSYPDYPSYMSFSLGTGFSAVSTTTGDANNNNPDRATRVKLWAVNYANPGNPVAYNKTINTPTAGIKTYTTHNTVLLYKGNATSSDNAAKYRYEMTNLESLGWVDNKGETITSVNKAIKMATPTSYYYISPKFWGVKTGIPSPGGGPDINVPEGSIGFTVQPHKTETTSKVYIIVATDPLQDFNQTITISRFGSGTNQNGDRTVVENASIPLPPVPGATQASTIPITITDGGIDYLVYPNLNVLLVAYIISVPVLTVPITYFLESSQGTASFVYLSSERTAAKDNNPDHENDVQFPPLDWVDYVFMGTNNRIATVGSPEYKASLTATYFGVTRNPANLDGSNEALDALIVAIATSYDFTYAINRAVIYNSATGKDVNTIFITVNILAPSNMMGDSDAIISQIMANYNFNFSEYSRIENYEFSYSDAVVLNINGKLVNWKIHV